MLVGVDGPLRVEPFVFVLFFVFLASAFLKVVEWCVYEAILGLVGKFLGSFGCEHLHPLSSCGWHLLEA